MTDQTVGFLDALDLGPVDLVGWSDGGMVGTLIAAEHPERVRTLTVTGSGFSTTGYVPGAMEDLVDLAPEDDDMVMFAAMYAHASPDGPEHFAEVWEKMRAMWAEPFDWTESVRRISAPTLVVVGDDDYITVGHAEEFSRIVENGQLAVVPGASHLLPDGEAGSLQPSRARFHVESESGDDDAPATKGVRIAPAPGVIHPSASSRPSGCCCPVGQHGPFVGV